MKNSTTCFSSVSSATEMLRYLFPVRALVHVGAGDGHAAAQRWQKWNVPHVVFIEANPEYKESLQETTGQHDGWLAVSAQLGEQEAETKFYEASNPWESGAIPPEKWQGIWPNLTQTASTPLQQHRLEALLKESPCDLFAQEINWANIDCMPALPIIKGAGASVRQWDVIRVRVILDTSFVDDTDAGLDEIVNYLAPYDFRCVAVTESHHPAVGEALFVRNWKRLLQNGIAELQEEQAAQDVRAQSQLDQLTSALDEQTRLAEERSKQLGQADQALAENKKSLAEQERLAGDRQHHLDQAIQKIAERDKKLSKAREQFEGLKSTHSEQEKQLGNVNKQLLEKDATLDGKSRLVEEQQKKISELQAKLQEFETEKAEVEHRQQLLDDELVKAEAQLALITDILIREKNF